MLVKKGYLPDRSEVTPTEDQMVSRTLAPDPAQAPKPAPRTVTRPKPAPKPTATSKPTTAAPNPSKKLPRTGLGKDLLD